jgi:hypothetical protein
MNLATETVSTGVYRLAVSETVAEVARVVRSYALPEPIQVIVTEDPGGPGAEVALPTVAALDIWTASLDAAPAKASTGLLHTDLTWQGIPLRLTAPQEVPPC